MSVQTMRPADARAVYSMAQSADAADAQKQVRTAARWRGWLIPVMTAILLINAYFASRALFYFADLGGSTAVFGEGGAGERLLGGLDRAAMVLTATAIIFAAQVLAVRLALLRGAAAIAGWILLALCAAFSIITSTLCIAIMLQGGIDAGVRGSDAYQLAKNQAEGAQSRASSAAAALPAAEARARQTKSAYSEWQSQIEQQFGRGSAAYNTRMRPEHPEHVAHLDALERARADLQSARLSAASAEAAAPAALQKFEAVKSEGGGAASHSVMTTMAGWFGTTAENFAIGFSLFVNVLMELVRLFLAFVTGAATVAAIRSVQADETQKADAAPTAPAPAVSPEEVASARAAYPRVLQRAAMRRSALSAARARLRPQAPSPAPAPLEAEPPTAQTEYSNRGRAAAAERTSYAAQKSAYEAAVRERALSPDSSIAAIAAAVRERAGTCSKDRARRLRTDALKVA